MPLAGGVCLTLLFPMALTSDLYTCMLIHTPVLVRTEALVKSEGLPPQGPCTPTPEAASQWLLLSFSVLHF